MECAEKFDFLPLCSPTWINCVCYKLSQVFFFDKYRFRPHSFRLHGFRPKWGQIGPKWGHEDENCVDENHEDENCVDETCICPQKNIGYKNKYRQKFETICLCKSFILFFSFTYKRANLNVLTIKKSIKQQ